MLILLYGEDTFRVREKLNQIVGQYSAIHTSGFNIQKIDCQKCDVDDLRGILQTNSLFKERKFLILKNVFLNGSLQKELLSQKALLKETNDALVFFEEGKIKASEPLFLFLKENAKTQEFAPLKPSQLMQWAEREFERFHTKADIRVVEMLVAAIGNDLWRFSQEIQKLVAFAHSRGARVQENDVRYFLKQGLEADIFATIEDISRKNKKAALERIASHFEKGESAPYIFSMLLYQFRNLLILKNLQGKRSKLHPFVVKKSFPIAQKFSAQELKAIYKKLFEFDLATKQGRVAPEAALYSFVTQL